MDINSNSKPFAPVPEKLAKPTGIKRIIAVISGKGGVGKSTISANLAVSMSKLGLKTGLFDADITGHSQSLIFNTDADSEMLKKSREPAISYGVKVVSFGLLYPAAKPVIWRGPMISNALKSIFIQTNWGELDYLFIDLPPGTSDAQLTILRDMPIDGAIVITTPDPLASAVAERGLTMLFELQKRVLGIIENMSPGACPHCGDTLDIFGSGAGEKLAQKYGVAFLGQIPLDPEIKKAAANRKPVTFYSPDTSSSEIFTKIAKEITGSHF